MVRTTVYIIAANCDPDLRRSLVPLSDPRVWDWEGFKEMNRLGWSSFMVKVAGWWAFDVFTLLTGMLPSAAEPSAQTILRNIGLYTFMIPIGMGSSMNYFVGKYIGKDRTDLAYRIFLLGKGIAFGWSFASMSFCAFFK